MKTPPKTAVQLTLILLGMTLAATPARAQYAVRPPVDEAQEAAWFAQLPQVNPAALQPGDVLIRKVYGAGHKVKLAQETLFQTRGAGAPTSVHAMLYVGNGMVAEASATAKRVQVQPLPSGIDVIAWRPTDPSQAASAVRTAYWLASQNIKYSIAHCLMSLPRSSSWGPLATRRANQIANHQLPTGEMMCSEFVAFAFQGIAGRPYIQLDAMRVAPMRLEDYLNSNPHLFAFVGTIPANNAAGQSGFGPSNPGFGTSNPGFGPSNPGFGTSNPGFGPPTLASERPTLASERPTLASERPTLASDRPTLASDRPTLASERPTPGFGPSNPGFGPSNPGFGPSNPGFGPSNPGFGPSNPGFGPSNPGFAPSNPGFAPSNPGFGPSNPGFGTNSGPYGQPLAGQQGFTSGQPSIIRSQGKAIGNRLIQAAKNRVLGKLSRILP